MLNVLPEPDVINFGELSPQINDLLQRGVVAYRTNREEADKLFKQALALTPTELAPYYCLYKIHTYMGSLDFAAEVASAGLREAAKQAGWPVDPGRWAQPATCEGPARFALYTLKALSFIELRRGRKEKASEYLAILARTDPFGHVGWRVVEELADGVQ